MASLDGLTLHRAVNELSRSLTGGRIDRINQPDTDEIVIAVRSGGENYRLLICASPDSCRIQLTDVKKPNPQDAPMFCMLMRKHLTGGRIIAVTQPDTDRIVRIEAESTDELYNTDRYYIICELMGRYSNIILTNSQGIIIDSIKRVGIAMSSARTVMPGQKYEYPPTEKKQNPLTASAEDIESVLRRGGRTDKLLSSAFYGVAPIVCSVFTPYADEYTDTMSDELIRSVAHRAEECFLQVAHGESVCLVKRGDKEFFSPCEPGEGEYRLFDSPSRMLDLYYSERDMREYMRRRSYTLSHAVEQKLQRERKKLAAFDEAIAGEGDYDKYRVYGELVTANLYKIRTGDAHITVENYYEAPPVTVDIPLDRALSGIKNAQKYFKLYKKAKGARDTALAMRSVTSATVDYLLSVQDCINRAKSPDEVDLIRAELEEQKIVRREKAKPKKLKKQPPYRYVSSDGFVITVGRNNLQNDELTFKTASAGDTWLHVKNRPGSHTVILNPERVQIPDTTLYEAACCAAYHSSCGEGGTKTEVDYTLCRYVKKPAGALPGKVIYTNQKTILAVPQLPKEDPE